MDINARRHPQPFEPGELVRVVLANTTFDPALVYEVKSGKNEDGLCELWTDEQDCRYNSIHDRWLVPADVEG